MSLSHPSVPRSVQYGMIWYVEKLIFVAAFVPASFLAWQDIGPCYTCQHCVSRKQLQIGTAEMIAKPLLRASQACFLGKARKPPLLCHAANEKEKRVSVKLKAHLQKNHTKICTHTFIAHLFWPELSNKKQTLNKVRSNHWKFQLQHESHPMRASFQHSGWLWS